MSRKTLPWMLTLAALTILLYLYGVYFFNYRGEKFRSHYYRNADDLLSMVTRTADGKSEYFFSWFLDRPSFREALKTVDGITDTAAVVRVFTHIVNSGGSSMANIRMRSLRLYDSSGRCIAFYLKDGKDFIQRSCELIPRQCKDDMAGGHFSRFGYHTMYQFGDGGENGSWSLCIDYSISDLYGIILKKYPKEFCFVMRTDSLNMDEGFSDFIEQPLTDGWSIYGTEASVGYLLENLKGLNREGLSELGSEQHLILGDSRGEEGELLILTSLIKNGTDPTVYLAIVHPADEVDKLISMSLTGFLLLYILMAVMAVFIVIIRYQGRKLEKSEYKFRLMSDFSLNWEYWEDPEGKMLVVSPSCERISGYPVEEFLRDPDLMARLIVEEDLEKWTLHHLQFAAGEHKEGTLQYRIKRRDGEIRWIEHICYPVYGDRGEYLGRRGSNVDVTGSHDLQQEISSSNQIIEQMFRHGSLGIALLNSEGKVTRVNSRYLEFFGLKDKFDAIMERSIFDDPVLKTEKLQAALEHVFRDHQIETWEMEYRLDLARIREVPDAGVVTRWVYVTAIPVSDEEGRLANVVLQIADITERKIVEGRLRQSEEMFRNIWENSGTPMRICRPDGVIIDVNSSFCSTFRKTREELVGASMDVIYREDERENVLNGYLRNMDRRGTPDIMEKKIRTWFDEEKWFSISHTLMENTLTGEVLLSVFMDITDLKAADDAILKSEEKYRMLAENSSMGITVFAPRGIVEMMNSIVLEREGFLEEGVVGRPVRDVFGSERGEDIYHRIHYCVQSGRSRTYEVEIDGKNGRKWYADTYDPLYDRTGKIQGVQLLSQDITARKTIELETERIHSYYRKAIGNLKGIPYLLNYENDSYEFFSEEAELIFGIPIRSITPAMLRSRVAEIAIADYSTDRPGSADEYGEEFRKGHIDRYQAEYTLVMEDGVVKYINDSSIPIEWDSGGRVRKVFGIMQDISGRKAQENEKKQLEEQLRQSQKMESIGHLAGGVAHDFNNILTAQIVFASLLAEKVTDPEQKSLIEQIQLSNERAENLIRQLLAFSRKQQHAPRNIELNGTVTNLKKMLRRMISEDIQLVFKMDPGVGRIFADPSQIEQIIINLVVNAKDAMAESGSGNREIRISTEQLRLGSDTKVRYDMIPAGNYAVFSVEDTGSGIRPELLESIFEPFFTTKEPGKGTGLGLSTVFGIIKQNDAFIDVSSVPGSGTVFKIFWPVPEGMEQNEDTDGEKEEVLRGSERILFVEDDDLTQIAICGYLEELGYEVVKASDGVDALQKFREPGSEFSCVITDLTMPRMGGMQLIEEIRAVDPEQNIILCSGYNEKWNELKDSTILDTVPFLSKPYHIGDLSRLIRKLLDE